MNERERFAICSSHKVANVLMLALGFSIDYKTLQFSLWFDLILTSAQIKFYSRFYEILHAFQRKKIEQNVFCVCVHIAQYYKLGKAKSTLF